MLQKIWRVQVQNVNSVVPWSCAKQLIVQMETPTPQAYPAGIAPTPRTVSKQPAAMHPQGSRLFPPPDSKPPVLAATSLSHCAKATARVPFSNQSQMHHQASQSSSAAATPIHADAETLSACKQLDRAAARLVPLNARQQLAWQAQATAKASLQGSASELPEPDIELTSACQQLAEAAAGHAQHSATLQQALTELSSQHSASMDTADSPVAAARLKANQLEQSSCSSACGALLQAAEASCTEDVQDAEYTDSHKSEDPEDLALACEQLTEAVSAHASQHQQLKQLLQRQLAAPPSKGLHSAVTDQQIVTQPGRQHEAAKVAFDKAVGCSKPGPRVKQRCSAVYTAAWPPGRPDQQLKGPLMQASVAGRAAKGLTSRAGQLESSICTDAYQRANLGQLFNRALVQAKLPSEHEAADVVGVDRTGSPFLSSHDTLVYQQDVIRPQIHGLTTVVSDNAVGTAADAVKVLEGNAPASNDCESAAFGACLKAATEEVEPSFGAVHAMLSALQLPGVEAASPWEESTLAHTCNLLHENALGASEDSPEYTLGRSLSEMLLSSFAWCHVEDPPEQHHVDLLVRYSPAALHH